ncbi:hypothetical protein QN277_018958 [Acacia crassicarpa]|uniref:SHSP domain-containing protein n=1 Tax=Acacia crassicarpa TaxID=499986 RepID=A0AAE1MUV5_9FABA|nr:hypothetical protein QN277_018958 [Acacia crassicarpa]
MAQNRVYEDFQPLHDWARDERSDTLILPLEGFSRSQLKVQISSTRKIRVSGERQIEGNKWRRFFLEFPVPQDSDTNDIGAKFERGTLYVRFPKLITPVVMPPPPSRPPTQQPPPPPSRPLMQQAPPSPPPPPPPPAAREELKAEEAIETKPETKKDETKVEQEKEPTKEYKKEDISEGNKEEKAKAPETTEDRKKQAEKSRRAPISEGLGSMQGQDYKDASTGFVGELKKYENVINMLVVVFVVLLLGLYLKHLVVSYFGGSGNSHQEL